MVAPQPDLLNPTAEASVPPLVRHRFGWIALCTALVLAGFVPWLVYLALTIPSAARAGHYGLAWVGFDSALCAVLIGLTISAVRGWHVTGPLATVAATMFVLDAWFDITTSPNRDVAEAVVFAFAEIPLAALGAWATVHVHRRRHRVRADDRPAA